MRKFFYSAGVFLFLSLLSLGFYGSYKVSDMQMKIRNLEQDLSREQAEEAKAVDQIITQATQCTIEEYDRNTGELKEKTNLASDNMKGMSREALVEFLSKSSTAYYRYSLVAFSPQHVVIRQSRTTFGTYVLMNEGGKVAVYRGDRETLFEPTEIRVDSLPSYLQEEIQQGKYLDSEEELYNFLENYSS